MADYFQDILPPQGDSLPKPPPKPASPPPPSPQPISPKNDPPPSSDVSEEMDIPHENERSIRNITVTSRAPRRPGGDIRETPITPSSRTSHSPRLWLWIVAATSVILLGILLLLATRPTTVTVLPRSQVVTLDASSKFIAYPDELLPGVLVYRVEKSDFEDSAVVPAKGTEQVQEKARGRITVLNNYSTSPVTLVENTRFETPDGLIFRTPAKVSVPGKKGTQPGEISIEIVADVVGVAHNIGPIPRFTLPGLKNNAAMYADVYARSTGPMTGGFSGQRPIVETSALEAAKAEVRNRLAEKARAAAENHANGASVVIPDLIRVTYTSLPTTEEAGGNARIHEKVQVEIPVFPAEAFAQTIARGVSADAEEGGVVVKEASKLAALLAGEIPVLGADPIEFTLSGMAQLVWKVDAVALAEALAGKDEAAFEAIIASFPGVEEARARVQPFWKNSFPRDPNDIKVRIEEPAGPKT